VAALDYSQSQSSPKKHGRPKQSDNYTAKSRARTPPP